MAKDSRERNGSSRQGRAPTGRGAAGGQHHAATAHGRPARIDKSCRRTAPS